MAVLAIPLVLCVMVRNFHLFFLYRDGFCDWRDSIVFGYIGTALLFLVSCETLSLFTALNSSILLVVWSATLIPLLILYRLLLRRFRGGGASGISLQSLELMDWAILGVLCVVILLTAIVAYISPPNTSDVLAYHMPRVVHWIQNQTTANYAVPDARHLWMPPWPAYAQTNLYLLSSGDHLANMIQWSAMVLSVIIASRLAAYLGAARRGQLLAALFVATLPVGIDQASTSFTDYSAAAWVAVSALLVFRSRKTEIGWLEWIGLGLSVALGYLTKGTYVLFVLPFVVWFIIDQIRRTRSSDWLIHGAAIALLILILVTPYWIRNLNAFDSIMGPEAHISMLANETISLKGVAANFFRQTATQLASPSRALNSFLEQSVRTILTFLGIDPGAPSFSYQNAQFGVSWLFPGSDSNPLHLGILILSIIFVAFIGAYRNRDAGVLILLVFIGYLFFCSYIRWQSTARFTLAIYLLLAPVAGWVMGQGITARLSPAAAGLMILYAVPSLFFLRWRPLISWQPRTAIDSVLQVSREDLYFRASKSVRPQYEWVADRILQTRCTHVAMRTDSHDHEYFWWILLDPLVNGIQIEHTLIYPGLEDLENDDFQACAMICTVCSDSPKERDGLWPINLEDDIKLFLSEEYLDE